MSNKVILLSAGHGGADPGATGNGIRESDANLAITLACRDYLAANYTGHKLVLPRATDIAVTLANRVDLAKRAGADLYVSIHNNSFSDPTANGFETFLHSGPLFQQTFRYRDVMHNQVYSYLRGLQVRDRGKKRADHWITRNAPCPTVLMEYLFVSNPREAELLKRPEVLTGLGKRTAIGIAEALELPMIEQAPQDVWYRVVAGSYRDRQNAERAVASLRSQGVPAFLDIHREG